MKNHTKRMLSFVCAYMSFALALMFVSYRTNWFHFSLATYGIAFVVGGLYQFIIDDLGWEEDDEA